MKYRHFYLGPKMDDRKLAKKVAVEAMRRQARSSDFLEKMVKNPETGNNVKVKTLMTKPKDSPAYKKYEQLRDKRKKDKGTEDEPSSSPKKRKSLLTVPANLPPKAAQNVKTGDDLFKQATVAHEKQLDWLNRGKRICKAVGGKVLRYDEGKDKGPLPDGPVIIIGPMKKRDRSEEKVAADYGGDWTKITDVVRASIAVDNYEDMADVVAKLEASGMKIASQPKDRFQNPTDAGYRDMLLNVRYDDGHVGELQLHLKPVLEAKKKGHKFYEKVRSIEASAKKEGRETLTDDEQKIIDEANAKMKALYDAAWDKATKGKQASTGGRVAAQKKYYVFDELPCEWETGKFPLKYAMGKKKPVVVYELQRFSQEAMPISKRDFDKLRKG